MTNAVLKMDLVSEEILLLASILLNYQKQLDKDYFIAKSAIIEKRWEELKIIN